MNEYTYPFDTCEKSNENGIAQPYSALFNLINSMMIIYFLFKTKKNYTFILLFSLLCFELFHVFSHINHIQGDIQTNIQHLLTYSINLSVFYVFYCYTNKLPSYKFIFYLIALICFDIYSINYLTLIYYLSSQFAIFISLLLYYLPLLPKFIHTSVYQIIFLVCCIIFLFWNEKHNCEKMLKIYPSFPFHILIETVGIITFYIICKNFSKL
jgi:hypothetical protein